uniref:ABC transporter ATP-binding protein n=1 Tax=Pseudactinotalea sp. TaxID=1926260 RepID=UPI003B3B847D
RQRAQALLDTVGLGEYARRAVAQLSGGQQQRVALARAVATRPDVLLLDEPLSNLDARLRLEARTFLKELQRELGVTTVFVTHDQAEALALADRIAVMSAGKLIQVGSPREVFAKPATTFVAGFIGSTPMNLISGKVDGGRVRLGSADVSVPADAEGVVDDGAEVVWGARPEYLGWSPTAVADGVEAEVTVVENLGASVLVTAMAGEDRLQLVLDEDDEPEPGSRGWVTMRPHRTLLFDAETGERLDARGVADDA